MCYVGATVPRLPDKHQIMFLPVLAVAIRDADVSEWASVSCVDSALAIPPLLPLQIEVGG